MAEAIDFFRDNQPPAEGDPDGIYFVKPSGVGKPFSVCQIKNGKVSKTEYQRAINLTVNTPRATAAKETVEAVNFEDGVLYNVLFADGTHIASPTLNGKPIRLGATAANTTVLSFAAGSNIVVPLLYDALNDSLQMQGSFRTTDVTEAYAVRWNGASVIVGENTTRYKILMMASDGRYHPIVTGDSTAVNTKTVNTVKFVLGSPIIGFYRSETIAAGDPLTANYVYEAQNFSTNFRYNQNVQSGWIANKAVYLKGTVGSDGLFTLAGSGTISGDYMTQDLPTSEDRFVYILWGYMGTATTSMRLISTHPIYEFKNGGIRLFSPASFPSFGWGAGQIAEGNGVVRLSTNQTIAGTKTFSSHVMLPSSNPSNNRHAASKSYVDALSAQLLQFFEDAFDIKHITSNLSVTNAHKFNTLILNGNIKLTLTAATSFDANFQIAVANDHASTASSIVLTAVSGWTYRINDGPNINSGSFGLKAGGTCTIIRKASEKKFLLHGDFILNN